MLARPGDAWVAGGAVALALLAGSSEQVAVLAAWSAPSPSLQAPATPAARRLAAKLAERGHAARASGRLVAVACTDPAEAARAGAAASGAPVVRVLAGPRDEAAEGHLGAADRVVVAAAGEEDAVAALAAAGLGAPLLRVDAPAAARTLAATGVALTGALRSHAAEVLR